MPSKIHQVPSSRTLSDTVSSFNKTLVLSVKDTHAIPKITKRILKWAGSHTEITQIICGYVAEHAAEFNDTNAEALVDHIVETSIIDHWRSSRAASHLQAIVDIFLDSDRKDLLLLSYLKILQRGSVAINRDSPEQATLLRSGLITRVDRQLVVSNPLYAQVFNLDWIEQQLPGITRPVTIIGSPLGSNAGSVASSEETSSADISLRSVGRSSSMTGSPIAKPRQLEDIPESRRPSAASGFYSKLAVLACCIAVAGAAVSTYRYESAEHNLTASQPTERSVGSFQAASANDLITPENGQADTTQDFAEDLPEAAETTASETTEPAAAAASVSEPDTTDRAHFDKGVEHATNSRWLPMVREFCQLSPNSTYYPAAERQLESWAKLYTKDIKIAQSTFASEERKSCLILEKALDEISS